jgi:hypothetical protein
MSKVKADFSVLIRPGAGNPVDIVGICVVFIIAEFMLNKQKYQDADRHSQRQAKDVY